MNETSDPKMTSDQDDLLPEYKFDYSKARPNRFVAEQPEFDGKNKG